MTDDNKRAGKDNTGLEHKPREMVRRDVAPRGAMAARPQGVRPTLKTQAQGATPPQTKTTQRPPQPRPTLNNLKVGAGDRGKLSARLNPEVQRPAQTRPTVPQAPTPATPLNQVDKALGMGNNSTSGQNNTKANDTDKPSLFTKLKPAATPLPKKGKGMDL